MKSGGTAPLTTAMLKNEGYRGGDCNVSLSDHDGDAYRFLLLRNVCDFLPAFTASCAERRPHESHRQGAMPMHCWN
jgi:hypothetical protein